MSTKKLQILGNSGLLSYQEQALTDEQKLQARTNIGAGEPQVQSDWSQNDETAPDYIKNKPLEETEDDAMEMLADMGIVDPVIDEEGNVLTDESGNILTI